MLNATTRPAEAEKALERAADLYEDLFASAPSVPEYSSILWKCYFTLRDMHPAERPSTNLPKTRQRALAAYHKLRDSGSNQAGIYNSLGCILCDVVKDYDAASDCFRRAIELNPKIVNTYDCLGAALEGQKKYPEAIVTYRKALELAPQHAHLHNSLAWLLTTCPDVKLRDPTEALALAEKAAKLDPKDERTPVILGAAYYRTGNWNAAMATLQTPIQRSQLGQRLDWCLLAMAQWQSGNRDAARVSYQKVVESMEKNEPDASDMIRLRSEAAELLGIPQTQPCTAPATQP